MTQWPAPFAIRQSETILARSCAAVLLRKTEREPPHARAPMCSHLLMKRAILTRGSPTVLLIAASERSSAKKIVL
jgi:hypothetical protein